MTTPHPPTRTLVRGALLVAVVAALILAAQASFFDPTRLHVSGRFIDQATYIRTARILLDTGELRSGLIYPAYADQPEWRPYMPGHYLALALSYAVFGFGVVSSLLPNLVAHVLASVCVFLVGARLYSLGAGLTGALLFALYPPDIAYAFTAMGMSTPTAAAAAALAVFVFLPRRLQPWLTPLLLSVPFLFRETQALCVIPLAALILFPKGGERRIRAFLACGVASVGLLMLLNDWQIRAGKMSMPVAVSWVTGGFDYYDGAPPEEIDMTLGEFATALRRNLGRNGRELARQWQTDPLQPSLLGLGMLLVALGITLTAAVRRRTRDPLALGTATLTLLIVAMIVVLYDVKGHKLIRHTLFVTPFLAVVAGSALNPAVWSSRFGAQGVRRAGMVLGAVMGLGAWLAGERFGAELIEGDGIADLGTATLERLQHDDGKLLLVHPFLARYTLDYAVHHYPVPWSFIPKRLESMHQLEQRFAIGTLLISTDTPGAETAPSTIHAGKLRLREHLTLGNTEYLVYQARR